MPRFLTLLLLAAAALRAAEHPAVTLTASPVDLTVGDPVDLTLTISTPPGWTLLPPDIPTNLGGFELLDLSPPKRLPSRRLVRLRLAAYNLGTIPLDLPPFRLVDATGRTNTVQPPPLLFTVRAISASNAPPPSPKPPIGLHSPGPIRFVLLTAVAVAAVALFLLRRGRRLPPVTAPPSVPALRADEEAVAALDRLLAAGFPSTPEAVKEFHDRAADIVRSYLGRVMGLPTMERTTDEVLTDLRSGHRLPDGLLSDLERLLRDADLVKFAKHLPDPQETAAFIPRAKELVRRLAASLPGGGES